VRIDRPRQWLVVAVGAVVLAAEAYLLFVNRAGTFRIEGERPYEVAEFAAGQWVRQAFLMQGTGLQGVRVLVAAREHVALPVKWKLWRGHPDDQKMALSFEGTETLEVRAGRHWMGFSFIRDGSSNDRWYTFEIALERPVNEVAPDAVATLVASHDNPDRGGVLWVGERRAPGSLFLRADRIGRTLYTRFRTEAVPNLPSAWRFEAVHWLLFLSWHIAFYAYVRAVLREGWSS